VIARSWFARQRRSLTLMSACLALTTLTACAGPPEPPEPPVGDEQTAPMSLPIPETCPTAQEFGTAYVSNPGFVEAVEPSLVSTEVSQALPAGGCGFAVREPGTSTSGTPFREVIVAFFNLDEPGKLTASELDEWAIAVGATPNSDSAASYGLPTDFAGFSRGYVVWEDGSQMIFLDRESAMVAHLQGQAGIIRFPLGADRVEALVAASTDGLSDLAPGESLAAGFPERFRVEFSMTDAEGYSMRLDARGSMQPWTAHVANSPPGKFEPISVGELTVTAANTTDQRNTEVSYVRAIVVYPKDSLACEGVGSRDFTSESYCYSSIGTLVDRYESLVLSADEVLTAETGTYPLKRGVTDESSTTLAELNQPSGIYMAIGHGGSTWQSDKGCGPTVQSSNSLLNTTLRADWIVPMEGWPDPLCD